LFIGCPTSSSSTFPTLGWQYSITIKLRIHTIFVVEAGLISEKAIVYQLMKVNHQIFERINQSSLKQVSAGMVKLFKNSSYITSFYYCNLSYKKPDAV